MNLAIFSYIRNSALAMESSMEILVSTTSSYHEVDVFEKKHVVAIHTLNYTLLLKEPVKLKFRLAVLNFVQIKSSQPELQF